MEEARIQTKSGEYIPMIGVDATGEMIGVFLRMTLQQRFRNTTNQPMEVTYSFPLPQGAVLLHAEIHIRGTVYTSQVSETPSARATYDKSIAAGDTAILISHDADFYTLQLGNVPAGEDVSIVVRYGEFLTPMDDKVRISLPTTIAPRYGAPPPNLRPEQVPTSDLFVQYPFTYQLLIHGRSVAQVQVVSHVAIIEPQGDAVHVEIAGASMDRDVVVHVAGYQSYRASMAVSHERQHWYGTYVTVPQAPASSQPVAMHIKLLIDCSGSMDGSSIAQARQAVMRVLGALRDGDSIAVTRFGSDVVDVTPGLMTVGTAVKKQMGNWTRTIEADLGGTEIAGAIKHVLQMPTNGHACDIILLTDGEAWRISETAAIAARMGHRIFPVVIGHASSDGELHKLAKRTGGSCESVTPNERIDEVMMRIVRRIKSQTAIDAQLTYGDAVVAWEHGHVPHFQGDTGLIVAVTDRAIHPQFTVEGASTTIDAVSVPESLQVDSIRTLAALRLHDLTGAAQTKWALTHQLISDTTTLVAVATHTVDQKVVGEAVKAVVAQELAYDWHGSAGAKASMGVQSLVFNASPVRAMRASAAPVMRRMAAPSRGLMESVNDLGDMSRVMASVPPFQRGGRGSALNKYTTIVTKALAAVNGALPTIAQLHNAGLAQDTIDALCAIAGYSDEQIVAAIIVVVLGDAMLPQGTAMPPAALVGGVKVMLEAA